MNAGHEVKGVVVNMSKFPKSTNLKFSPLFLLTLCYLPVARLFWTPRTISLPLNGTNDGIAAHIWAYIETCSTQTMDTGSSFTIIKSFGSHLHDRRISINIIIGYDPITIHKSISRRRYSSPITRFWGACFIIHSQSIHLIHSIALSLSHSCTHRTLQACCLMVCTRTTVFPCSIKCLWLSLSLDENRKAFPNTLSIFWLFISFKDGRLWLAFGVSGM